MPRFSLPNPNIERKDRTQKIIDHYLSSYPSFKFPLTTEEFTMDAKSFFEKVTDLEALMALQKLSELGKIQRRFDGYWVVPKKEIPKETYSSCLSYKAQVRRPKKTSVCKRCHTMAGGKRHNRSANHPIEECNLNLLKKIIGI